MVDNRVLSLERASAKNVIRLPSRQLVPRPKKVSRRKNNIVLFTVKKRFVYDRDEVVAHHMQQMTDTLLSLFVRVSRGEITGLLIAAVEGHQGDPGELLAQGIFADEPEFAVYVTEQMVDMTKGMELAEGAS